MLEEFGPSLYVADGPTVSFYGFPYTTRMAVARLADGSAWVWSPIALDPQLDQEVGQRGSDDPARPHDHDVCTAGEARGAGHEVLHPGPKGIRRRSPLGLLLYRPDGTKTRWPRTPGNAS